MNGFALMHGVNHDMLPCPKTQTMDLLAMNWNLQKMTSTDSVVFLFLLPLLLPSLLQLNTGHVMWTFHNSSVRQLVLLWWNTQENQWGRLCFSMWFGGWHYTTTKQLTPQQLSIRRLNGEHREGTETRFRPPEGAAHELLLPTRPCI